MLNAYYARGDLLEAASPLHKRKELSVFWRLDFLSEKNALVQKGLTVLLKGELETYLFPVLNRGLYARMGRA